MDGLELHLHPARVPRLLLAVILGRSMVDGFGVLHGTLSHLPSLLNGNGQRVLGALVAIPTKRAIVKL